MKLGDLYVQLKAKGAEELAGKLKETQKQAKLTAEQLRNIGTSLTIAGGIITAFVTKAVYYFTKYTTWVDRLMKVTGASAEAIQGLGYAAEQERLRQAYAKAYRAFFRDYLPDNGVPARFTVHLVDVPDKAASYEFYGTALYQKALQEEQV